MNITPLFDRVVLTETKQEKSNNIIIPQDQEEKPQIAEVVAVGSGGVVDGVMVEMVLKVGDKVLFNKYAGHEFIFEDKKYILIKQSDILGIVN